MKKGTKITLGVAAIGFSVLAVTGCTKSFCSNTDTSRMLYAFDPGVTRYTPDGGNDVIETYLTVGAETYTYSIHGFTKEVASWDGTTKKFAFADKAEGTNIDTKELTYLNEIISSANSEGVYSISAVNAPYFERVDQKVLELVCTTVLSAKKANIDYDLSNADDYAKFSRDLSFYSYLKYVSSDSGTVYTNYFTKVYDVIRSETSANECPSTDFITVYRAKLNSYISLYRSCLTTKTDKYGSYGYKASVFIEKKTWGFGWEKGLFEGLLVFPIGALIDSIAFGFNNSGVSKGGSALLAILFVTIIVRLIMVLATIKSTAGNAKMTELQPEIQKIQNKYPNSNTSQAEKQRMAQEMQALYKKNGVNPFTSILIMIIQFPVFICVWGALSGSAALSSGTFLGLDLSLTIREVLFNKAAWASGGGALTALFLFLLMAIAQTFSMLLPQWIQKAKAKKVAKLGKNPAQKQQNNRMKWFTYIMLAMIIFMGFSLVSAMGVYWFIGALISIAQTLIMQTIAAKKKKNRG